MAYSNFDTRGAKLSNFIFCSSKVEMMVPMAGGGKAGISGKEEGRGLEDKTDKDGDWGGGHQKKDAAAIYLKSPSTPFIIPNSRLEERRERGKK